VSGLRVSQRERERKWEGLFQINEEEIKRAGSVSANTHYHDYMNSDITFIKGCSA